jgi:hypothetical protein
MTTTDEKPNLTNFSAEFFTENELALALDRDRRTLRRWANLRQGPPRTRIGKSIYYRRSSVLRWLIEHEERPLSRRRMR